MIEIVVKGFGSIKVVMDYKDAPNPTRKDNTKLTTKETMM